MPCISTLEALHRAAADFAVTDLDLVIEPPALPAAGAFLAGGQLADHPLLWFGDGRITAGHLAVLRERAAAMVPSNSVRLIGPCHGRRRRADAGLVRRLCSAVHRRLLRLFTMSEDAIREGAAEEVQVGGDERPAFDTSVAHQARIYDYWLGGKDNFAADRKAAEEAFTAYPGVVTGARANRQFLARAVRHLVAEAGVRQFLDIGTGIPTANNTHEVAQATAPESSVVYVDYDPIVLLHARALLASTSQGRVDYLDADLRDTGAILEQASQTLDFSQPVAIMLIAILHAIGDDDDPYQIVAALMDAVPPGSYLVLSHVASDIDPEQIAKATARLNQLSHQHFTLRDHAQVLRFFDGLELLEPGVVRVEEWRSSDLETRLRSAMWGGVGRKG